MGCGDSKQKTKTKNPGIKVRPPSTTKSEYKIVFLGDKSVGKSSIAKRFCFNKFDQAYEVTIGGVYNRQEVALQGGKSVTLHLWDTGGEERFQAMAPLYYRDANGAVLVYDVGDEETFKSIDFWLKELDNKVRQDGLVIALAGNQCDIPDKEKKVSQETAQKFAIDNNLIFFQTSAKKDEGYNINELMYKLAENILQQQNLEQ